MRSWFLGTSFALVTGCTAGNGGNGGAFLPDTHGEGSGGVISDVTGSADSTADSSKPSDTTTAFDAQAGDTGSSSKGNVGDPCTVDGDCSGYPGLTCFLKVDPVPAVNFPGMVWPGGYCSKACSDTDQDCGEAGSCSQSGSGGGQTSYKMQYCVKACKADTDCRSAEGYKCQIVMMGFGYCTP